MGELQDHNNYNDNANLGHLVGRISFEMFWLILRSVNLSKDTQGSIKLKSGDETKMFEMPTVESLMEIVGPPIF